MAEWVALLGPFPQVHLGRALPMPPTPTLVSAQAALPSAAGRGVEKAPVPAGAGHRLSSVGGEPRLQSPEARAQVEKRELS